MIIEARAGAQHSHDHGRLLADRVLAAAPRLGRVRLVAVDGPSGSGKSTVAAGLVSGLRERNVSTGLVSTDDFATWDDPVGWWPRLVSGVLDPLSRGSAGRYRRMDWSAGPPQLGAAVDVELPEVLVVEGVSSGRSAAAGVISVLVWVELADPAQRLERAVTRDGELCRLPLRRWQDFEVGWFAIDRTRQRADVVVDLPEHRKKL